MPRRLWEGGGGENPPLAVAMKEAYFEEIWVYITRKQNTVKQYIATRPIMDLCEQSFWRPGAWVYWRWWEQEGIELEGAMERATAVLDGEDQKCREATA